MVKRIAACITALAALAGSAASIKSCKLENLVPLLTSADNQACWEATGVQFPPPESTAFSIADWETTCAVTACTNVFEELLTLTTSECTVGEYHAVGDLVNSYRSACGLEIVDVSTLADGGPETMSTSSGSASASAAIDDEEEITLPPATTKPNTTVNALTNSADIKTVSVALTTALFAVVGALVL